MVIYLEQGADLHIDQLMPLPLTVSCFSKIQIGFTFLVLAHPGSPRQRVVKWVCVCVCVVTGKLCNPSLTFAIPEHIKIEPANKSSFSKSQCLLSAIQNHVINVYIVKKYHLRMHQPL